jgi:hypothetical protein
VLFHLRHWSRSRAFREIYRGRLRGAPQTGGREHRRRRLGGVMLRG